MTKKRFKRLMDDLSEQATDMRIDIYIRSDCPQDTPCCSSVKKRAIIFPTYRLKETTEVPVIFGHEIAHIAHHDNLYSYSHSDKSLRLCERSADLGGAYYVVGSYMDIYGVDHSNIKTASTFMHRMNVTNSLTAKYIAHVGVKHMLGMPTPLKKIERLYGLYQAGYIDLQRFEYLKYELLSIV